MLQSISWTQFLKLISFGTVLFYGWVFFKYWGAELKTRIKGSRRANFEPLSKKLAPGTVQGMHFSETSSPVINSLIPTVPIPLDTAPQLFKAMETVIASLKDALRTDEGANKPTRTEILEKTKAVLSKFRQLKKTPYEAAINGFLIRTYLSDLSDNDLEGLWS